MQQQIFRAQKFGQAMAQVRATLGADALIVSRRQLRKPGGLYAGGPLVEITAMSAADAEERGVSGDCATAVSRLVARLLRGGVPAGAARALARRMESALPSGRRSRDEECAALASAVAVEMMFAPEIGSAARVAVMLGPTGVGKTTTIAKLAARAALIDKKRVGLVSLDQYRVGGIEQLQKYAELIGVPLEVAGDGSSLYTAVQRLSDADLVLIDTAGRSPRDLNVAEQLAECLDAARVPIEKYLCLPVAMRAQEMGLLVNQHAPLDPSRLICTKADEAVCCSGILAVQSASGLPVSYVTTGQRVPEDIRAATPELVADLLSGSDSGPS